MCAGKLPACALSACAVAVGTMQKSRCQHMLQHQHTAAGLPHQLSQNAPGWQLASVSTPSNGSLLCATIGTARNVRMPLEWYSCSQSCNSQKTRSSALMIALC